MTTDEALERAAQAAEEQFADGAERAARIRAMKSKPPDKSPEADERPMSDAPALMPDDAAWMKCPDCGNDWMLAGPPVVLEDTALTELQARYDSLLAQRDREYVEANTFVRSVREALRDTPGDGAADLDKAVRTLAHQWRIERDRREHVENNDADDHARALRRIVDLEAERDALKAQLEAIQRERDTWKEEADAYQLRWQKEQSRAAEAVARVEALTVEVKHREWRENGAPMEGEPTTPGASPFDGHPFVPMLGRPTLCGTCGYEQGARVDEKAAHFP